MRIIFHSSDKNREQELAEAFCMGARGHGHETRIEPLREKPEPIDCELAVMVGVKAARLFHASKAAGQRVLMLDKGYIRNRRAGNTWEYWRMSLDAHHPTGTTLTRFKESGDRFEAIKVEIAKWRKGGLQIVIAGSSMKYHEFYGLPNPTDYAREIVDKIRHLTDKPIVYRPKPSWRDAVPIIGTTFSSGKEGMAGVLTNAHCLVTHGSNACFEAALLGIPSIILGDGIAKPISSTNLDDIENPFLGKRLQWFANVAWHQFTEMEMRDGIAWQTIDKWLK